MPLYIYKCDKCNVTKKLLQVAPVLNTRCDCSGCMMLQLPTIMDPTVFETVDKRRNIKHRKDQDKRIKERAKNYFIENELGDLIAKIGLDKATKLGYIKKGKKIKLDDTK